MADFHSIIRGLKSRDHVEENLNAFIHEVKNRACRFALVDLSLKALSLAEICEESLKQADILEPAAKELMKVSESDICDRELIEKLRDENIRRMQMLTDDVDVYSTDEYLLNRIEHRFKDTKALPDTYSDQDTTDELLKFLSMKEDEEQNLYIVKLIEQLPVRMTKMRFLEIVAERMSIYKGNDLNAFEEAMMMLKSAALLKEISNPLLSEVTKALSETHVKEMTDKTYDSAFNILSEISVDLGQDIDLFQLYQEMLNDLLAYSISCDSLQEFEVLSECRKILFEVSGVLLQEKSGISEEIYETCTALEGYPEEYLMRFKETEGFENDVIRRYATEIDRLGLTKDLMDIQALGRLLSNSLYATLNIPETTDLDPVYYNRITAEFLKDLKSKLDSVTIPFARAVMARVFTVLPPRFSSQEELETYIYDSLRSCNDPAEKKGTIELLHQIMEE